MRLSIFIFALSLAVLPARGKTPTPTAAPTASVIAQPTPAPTSTPPTALTLSSTQEADVIAAQIVDQINSTLANVLRILDSGVPARGDKPAISAADIKTRLGPENLARIEAAQKALQGQR